MTVGDVVPIGRRRDGEVNPTGTEPLPDTGDPRDKGPATCAWCGKPAVKYFEVEPPIMGNVRGRRVVKKRAVTAPVCRYHYNRFENYRGQREAERKGPKS